MKRHSNLGLGALCGILLGACAPSNSTQKQVRRCASAPPAAAASLLADTASPEPLGVVIDLLKPNGSVFEIEPAKWEYGTRAYCTAYAEFQKKAGGYEVVLEGSSDCMSTLSMYAPEATLHVARGDAYVPVTILNPLVGKVKAGFSRLWSQRADSVVLIQFFDFLRDDAANAVIGNIAKEDYADENFVRKICSSALWPNHKTPAAFSPTPETCLWPVEGQHYVYAVKSDTGNAELLDQLVADTAARRAARASQATPATATELASLAKFETEWRAWQLELRRYWNLKYVRDTVLDYEEPDCLADSACIARKKTILETVRDLYPEEPAALAGELVERNFISYVREKVKAKYSEVSTPTFARYQTLAPLILEAQALRFKYKDHLRLTGHHLTGATTAAGGISYRAVPLLGGDGVPELLGLKPSFSEGDRLHLEFGTTGNNLRNELQNGTAVTLFGYKVGYVRVRTPNSEGAALMPLPSPRVRSEPAPQAVASPGPSDTACATVR